MTVDDFDQLDVIAEPDPPAVDARLLPRTAAQWTVTSQDPAASVIAGARSSIRPMML